MNITKKWLYYELRINDRQIYWEIHPSIHTKRNRVSTVSIVSDYGLDDRAIGVRSPSGENNFSFSLYIHIGSETHPAFCTMGTGSPFPGAKRGWGVTLTTHPHLVPRSKTSMRYTSSPPKSHHCMERDCFGYTHKTSYYINNLDFVMERLVPIQYSH
jgi:hypothetical protein